MDLIEKVIADIRAANSLQLLGDIYTWSASNIPDPAAVQRIAGECQARDAQLRAMDTVPPVDMPQAPAAPPAPVDVSSAVPVSAKPPGWLAAASDLAIGTRNATGNGGLPALDNLRVSLVDLAASAWDCGIDLTAAPHIKDVSAATPQQCWETALYMLDAIRTHLAIHKNRK
jgi:hypothetical protein